MNRYKYPTYQRPPLDLFQWIYKYDNVLCDEMDDEDLDKIDRLFPKLRTAYLHRSSLWINDDFIKKLDVVPEARRLDVIRKQQRFDTQALSDELKDPEARKKYE